MTNEDVSEEEKTFVKIPVACFGVSVTFVASLPRYDGASGARGLMAGAPQELANDVELQVMHGDRIQHPNAGVELWVAGWSSISSCHVIHLL